MSAKIIPWKDTHLTISNYKEPLKEVPKADGYGYYGCLLETVDKRFVQCHVCGGLFKSLGFHTKFVHNLPVKEYRQKFQLSPTTALISDDYREVLKQNTLKWLKSLTAKQKLAFWKAAKLGRESRVTAQPKISLETKNKRGTCPDQLISKILEVKEKMGRTPSLAEFIRETDGQRYKHLIFATFGSWLNALKIAKLKPKDQVMGGYRNYSDEELLESLTIFAQENKSIPTATDCKRGFLVPYEVYQRHFGTFENARQLAKVYDFVGK